MLGVPFTVATWIVGGAGGTSPNFRQAVANITFSPWYAVAPSGEQLGFGVVVTGAANAIVHLQWSPDNGTNVYDEVVEEVGALAAGERRYTCNIKAWGPITAASGILPMISRPAANLWFRVGVYSDGVPAGADQVAVRGVVQRGFSIQQAGG